MNVDLRDRVALVTGAESGIGAAVAKLFGASGAYVVVGSFAQPDDAAATVNEIRAHGGEAIALRADVGDEREVDRLFHEAETRFGTVDVLVNDAGINGHGTHVIDLSLELWEKTLRTNLTGPFLCSRRFLRGLRDAGKHGGKIVNVSSVHETMPMLGFAEYCASKGGLMMFTKTLALEAAKLGVNVNNVAPGAILTPMNARLENDPREMRHEREVIPWGRVGRPEEIARVVLMLASAQTEYMTGTTVFVDGGLLLNVASGPPSQA